MELATEPSFTKNQHFAYQRLQAILSDWERDKQINNYHYLYICGRQNGQKLKSVWVPSQSASSQAIKTPLFETEFLKEQQTRYLSLTDKKLWNNSRCKQVPVIGYDRGSLSLAETLKQYFHLYPFIPLLVKFHKISLWLLQLFEFAALLLFGLLVNHAFSPHRADQIHRK